MGTNYYVAAGKKKIHIGKSSCGWTFSFHAMNQIVSYRDWLIHILQNDLKIVDEYNKDISFEEFVHIVESKRDAKHSHAREFSGVDGSYLDPKGNSMSPGEFC